jgi:hypothetical protein
VVVTADAIERACERLVLDFAYFSDRQEYEALASLFTPGGTMIRPNGDALSGRAAILAAYRSRPGGRITRHICTNIRITAEAPDRAAGLTYAIVYSAKTGQTPDAHFGIPAEPRQLVGEFEDEFALTPEGWRIATRRARFVMHAERTL